MGRTRVAKSLKSANKGKIKNATALEYKGLSFKSKLEMFTYIKLLENGIDNFDYEKLKFTLLEGFEFNNSSIEVKKDKAFIEATRSIRPITYLPDFTCIDPETKIGWIIECKGYSNDAFPLKWKWFKDHLVKNGYNVILFKPNNQQNVLKTIEHIKQLKNNKHE
jgi:hypothetical protein